MLVNETPRARVRKWPRPPAAVMAVLFATLILAACNAAGEQVPAPGDPGGTTTGTGTHLVGLAPGSITQDDYDAAAKAEPFATKLADLVDQNRLGINFTWLLVTGFLVMFMQAGFALVETGFTRAKNAMHTISSEIGITIGDVKWGILGGSGFALGGSAYDVGVVAFFLFQLVFMDTAATIPTGSMAERFRFKPFVIYALFISAILYPFFANWAWGGGFLSQLGKIGLGQGYVDFAGSGVVHSIGGWCALAGAMVLGPRIGKYNRDGSSNPILGHNQIL